MRVGAAKIQYIICHSWNSICGAALISVPVVWVNISVAVTKEEILELMRTCEAVPAVTMAYVIARTLKVKKSPR